jgi:hypothetical protein
MISYHSSINLITIDLGILPAVQDDIISYH